MTWQMCMFCQKPTKAEMHHIIFTQKSSQISNCAESHEVMSCRLAGINDQIAAKAVTTCSA